MQAIEINGLMFYTETLLLAKDMILWSYEDLVISFILILVA